MDADSNVFLQPIANLSNGHRIIAQNIAYILQELPTLSLPESIRDEISQVCRDFEDALHDALEAIRILEDKLGLHPGEEPFDPGVLNPDPRVTMEFIEGLLIKEAETLNRLVQKLRGLEEQDRNTCILVDTLVTESAANILLAFGGIKEELRSISSRLSPSN